MEIKFIDGRPGQPDALPNNPNKRWRTRSVSKLVGGAIHHTAGGDNPVNTARYHVGANHTSPKGMPGLAYTFYIDKKGVITQAWDMDQQTWSQGGGTVPDVDSDGIIDKSDGLGAANAHFFSIVCGGSFQSRWNDTGQHPTFIQSLALFALVGHLTGEAQSSDLPSRLYGIVDHLNPGDMWPHSAFGKAACPGADIEDIISVFKASAPSGKPAPTTKDWQAALVSKGYDLGPYGPASDGVDGHWGRSSKRALVEYQKSVGIPMSAERDMATRASLFQGGVPTVAA